MVSLGWVGLDPAHNWDETSSLGVSIPYTNLGQVSAHPNEAMNSIKRMKLTGRHTGFAQHEGLAGGPGSLSLSFAG